MNVFLTGGTGFLGGAIARALLDDGAEVCALVRSHAKADLLRARGIHPHVRDLANPDSYAQPAEASDVIVHAGFQYAPDGSEMRNAEIAAVNALLHAARAPGRTRQFIYTSSVYLIANSALNPIEEDSDVTLAHDSSQWRLALESEVLQRGETDGFAAAVIRCGLIYGGNGGTMPFLFGSAASDHSVPFYGNGSNHWSLVYLNDAASLYTRVIERRATGIFHAVDGVPLPARRVAELASASAGCGGRAHSIPLTGPDAEHVMRALARDCVATQKRGAEVGWAPTFPSFEAGAARAFEEWATSH